MSNNNKASVLMITYNHEKYIVQAIESALMQKTNFDFEIVIGEDCSTDKTREIVISYAQKYPEKMNAILNEKNIGMIPNFIKTLDACHGKYIAILEGDDYWTDPNKLQKQVDFLENHEDFAMCFHRVKVIDEINSGAFLEPKDDNQKRIFTIYDLFKGNFMHTPSLVIKNGEYLKLFSEWFKSAKIGDWAITLIASQYGKIYYIPDVMAVYRKHPGGTHSTLDIKNKAEAGISIMELALKFFPPKYKSYIKTYLNGMYAYMLARAIRGRDAKQIKYYLRKEKTINRNMFQYLIFLCRAFFSFLKNFTIFQKSEIFQRMCQYFKKWELGILVPKKLRKTIY